ncbi:hypothetical protein ABNQ39_20640 [Azospirillum sp. A26]|uniref:hypothetical protein n=1 Tax=Azospirillum sp. A26 TaxID=3160607 RepID=UPI00367331F0
MAKLIPGRCPAFSRAADGKIDASTQTGAARLARKIEAKWKRAGCADVKVWVEMIPPAENAMPRPVIRSNLVNGMPPCP